MISEIRIVTLGVQDINRSVKFYNDAFQFVEKGRGTIDTKELGKAWRIPAGLKGTCAVIGPQGIDAGVLRLVQFDKPGERIWGDYSRKQDLGHYAVNFRAKDIKKLWPQLLKLGAIEKSPPTFWTINEQLSAWDSMCFDPDGVLLDIFQVEGNAKEALGEQRVEVSEVQTMAIHVSDALRSKAFYEGLEFSILYEKVVENMESFFGLPQGTKLHNVNLMKHGTSPNGRIELAQYVGYPGKPVGDRAVPPNLGVLSISFETDNLDETGRLVKKLGAQEISVPVIVLMPPFGKVKLATYFGLDKEVLEFYQRL